MISPSFVHRLAALGAAVALVSFAALGTYAAHADETATSTATTTQTAPPADPAPDTVSSTDATSTDATSTDTQVSTPPPSDTTDATSTASDAAAPSDAITQTDAADQAESTSTTASSTDAGGSILSGIASFPQAFWDFVKARFHFGTSTSDASVDASSTGPTASSTPSLSFLARLFSAWQKHEQQAGTSTAAVLLPSDLPTHPKARSLHSHVSGVVVSVGEGSITIEQDAAPSAGSEASPGNGTEVTVLVTARTSILANRKGSAEIAPGDLVTVHTAQHGGALSARTISIVEEGAPAL